MHEHPKTAPPSRYVTSTLSGEKVRAFVPPPLPPNSRAFDLASLQAIVADLMVRPPLSLTSSCSSTHMFAWRQFSHLRSRGRNLRSPTCCFTRTQRRLAYRWTMSKKFPTTWRPETWSKAHEGRISSLPLPRPGNSRSPSGEGARQPRSTGAVQKKPELDWRQSARQRGICSASPRICGRRHGQTGNFHPSRGHSITSSNKGRPCPCAV